MSEKRVLSAETLSEMTNNEKYFKESNDPVKTHDRDGHIIYRADSVIGGVYKMVKKLGKGGFARVILVHNTNSDKKFALKVIKNTDKCRASGTLEITALTYISSIDPDNISLCMKMLDSFQYNGSLCIAFEPHGQNVLQFLEDNHFQPFPLKDVRHISYQLCHAVNFLHKNGIAHTDIKPDNVLFVDSSSTKVYNCDKTQKIRLINRSDIRLIDFGNVVHIEKNNCFTISNRFYRAPEVVLKMEWTKSVDVWSIACFIYDICAGDPDVLFKTGDNNREHLAVMEKLLGTFPKTMTSHKKHFVNGKVNFNWDVKPQAQNLLKPLNECIPKGDGEHVQLLDLIQKMLEYDQLKRIPLNEALEHPFFNQLPSHQRL